MGVAVWSFLGYLVRAAELMNKDTRLESSCLPYPAGWLVTSTVGMPSETPVYIIGIFCLDVLGERCQSMSNGRAGAVD